ncbi:MAG: hypothetical protein LQ339_002375 [Xanthoria mediterranea]|nr:MAG: hypothetical protein LQ339_002375 [Xanthoria mediterranea]
MPFNTSTKWQHDRPGTSLTILFVVWKLLLLLIACTSPYPGYDTSTTLLTQSGVQRPDSEHVTDIISRVLANKLTRWDAIYFANIGHRGAIFEQEWAFGWGYAKIVGILSRMLFAAHAGLVETAVAGILVSNFAHLLSVLVLYQTSKLISPKPSSHEAQSVAFVSASLHITSPAGLFLSAPNAESSFSFLNFVGFHLYASSLQAHQDHRLGRRDVLIIVSGLALGLATTFRSNGLLGGLLFCFDIVKSICMVGGDVQSKTILSRLRRITILVISGALMAVGSAFPQYLAYREYCVDGRPEHRASWCTHRVPSIYAWVQSHYWNVGLFRYWTLSNAPLFVLAAPMLLILTASALKFLPLSEKPSSGIKRTKTSPVNESLARGWLSPVGVDVARRFAVPQILLALLALTTYHVQIVTRISSGYPLWYWWLASKIVARDSIKLAGCEVRARVIVLWMVMYACLQAGLFAAFLPPA